MARGRNHDAPERGAVIKLRKAVWKALCKKHPEFESYKREWEYNDHEDSTAAVPLRQFSPKQLEDLLAIYKGLENNEWARWSMGQVSACLAVLGNPEKAKISQLAPLETALIAWMKKDIIHGWVYFKPEKGDWLQPGLVQDVRYQPPTMTPDGSRNAPYVVMWVKWWQKGDFKEKYIYWHTSDLRGKLTVSELAMAKGIFHETKILTDEYNRGEAIFLKWRRLLGEQFIGNGKFNRAGEDRWSGWHDEDMVRTKLVVDDRCDEIPTQQSTMIFIKLSQDEEEIEEDGSDPAYERVPLGFFIWCFNLTSYVGGYVHSSAMRVYMYRPELREKLILDVAHEDLIDALMADMDVLMEDIVSGKSGGTCILCKSVQAGLGKTLTAEVYSECVRRPLYRIHSGQLGTDAESVEKGLEKALNNSKRWRAILLIDEADVFIAKRDTSLEKNAVVSVFLRLMEYYDGVMFLTTNRGDDVDDAVLSRCIAIISYTMPQEDRRKQLWLTLGSVYGTKLVTDKGMADKLAKEFACSGRDIKGLIRLVTKYARHHKKDIGFADFKRMAVYKGL